jgi:hypothetical protein
MNKYFVSDITDQVGQMNEMNCLNYKFEKYKIETVKGERFIVGKGKSELLEGNTELSFNEIHLLLSLINLVKGELPEQFYQRNPNVNELDSVISDKDVLKWVKTHGIPYQDKQLNKLLNDEQLRPTHVHIQLFKFRIATLYARFALWKATLEEDPQGIEKYKKALWTYDFHKGQDKNLDDLILVKKCLAQEVGTEANVRMSLRYDEIKENDEIKEKYVFTLSSDSILNIAYYQLASLISKPKSDSREKLKTCESCGSLFWTKHARRKYCCDRRTAHSRRKRNEERMKKATESIK